MLTGIGNVISVENGMFPGKKELEMLVSFKHNIIDYIL